MLFVLKLFYDEVVVHLPAFVFDARKASISFFFFFTPMSAILPVFGMAGVIPFLQDGDDMERDRVSLMLMESEDIKRFQLGHEKASV